MHQQQTASRSCPACGSADYVFRGRREVEREPGQAAVETKYRCKACGNEWRVSSAAF